MNQQAAPPPVTKPPPVTEPGRIAYSVTDAASVISVSRSTLYRLARAGQLRIIHLGGRRLVLDDDLRRLLADAAEASG